jgi:hypothetical protein
MATKKTASWMAYAGMAFGVLALGVGLYALATEPGVWRRFFTDLVERPDGPMSFRFILQPVMAVLAAYHDGVRDAATGRSPYFWSVLSDATERGARLREGLRATGKILAIGLAMDLAYQYFALGHFYPMEAVVVALLLAFIPYLLLRGPVARIATRRRAGRTDRRS